MFKPNMMEYVQVVSMERRQEDHSPLVRKRQMTSSILFIPTYVVLCMYILLVAISNYITFIDEFSINMWTYYLNLKDESFVMFK